ncbi:MAG: hypothetical protein LKE54_01815 [Prevotella sp.]|jgi:hypothetical protein|nr:hypothetical protein [Prevotella sp.]MCH3993792.1 hypothetical protein [Prevotella sp.]
MRLKFDIKEIEGLSGEKAHVYSVQLKGENETLLEQFFDENSKYGTDLKEIFNKLCLMGRETGCRRQWFKMNEGCPGDGVAALWYGQLRLYCLYFDKTAVFFGSGGYKPPQAHAYEEVPELNAKAQQMKEIAKRINQAIIDKDIVINEDGELTINDWDDEED